MSTVPNRKEGTVQISCGFKPRPSITHVDRFIREVRTASSEFWKSRGIAEGNPAINTTSRNILANEG